MDDETQSVADANESIEMALTFALTLAKKCVDHLNEFLKDGLSHALMEDFADGQGFTWHLLAQCQDDNPFVTISGHPCNGHGGRVQVIEDPERWQAIVGNQAATFQFAIPKNWINAASAGMSTLRP